MATQLQGTSTAAPLEPALEALVAARERTLALVARLSRDEIERVHSPILSPLAWDLAHIAAYEDLWLAHRHAGLELLRPDLAERYDAFETPRAVRGEVELLDAAEARVYMAAVRERVVGALVRRGVGNGFICEMVVRHELQHSETMRQTLALAGLLAADEGRLAPMRPGERWMRVAAGPVEIGAREGEFGYDNERPRHTLELGAFEIARLPVSSEEWTRFAEQGGYERRELWSPEGWEWKAENEIGPHPAIVAANPRAPACHVSWYEAEAFARSAGARLPSEFEWEKAATATSHATAPAARDRITGEAAVGTGRDRGVLSSVGAVWEWTASPFRGYPGFVAYPYREYSQVFFGDSYRVLRGGSWATSSRVATARFRNWDLPQRRQIFAGARLARDIR